MNNKTLLVPYVILMIATHSVAQVTGSLKDLRDGKDYKTVAIGLQIWMAENLAFNTKTGCWAYNDSIIHVASYGYLYNWETAKNACPTGWHLPGDDEWTVLMNHLGGKDISAGKIRATTGWFAWDVPSSASSNSSRFTALPAGSRDGDGNFEGNKYRTFWWSSTLYDPGMYWYISLEHSDKAVGKNANHQSFGYSVRCVKDR